jgi:ABC-2 type transport system permease protein
MSRPVSRTALVWAIVAKDLRSFVRDRLWVILTPFSIAFVALAFWIAPNTVDDTISVGVCPPEAMELFSYVVDEEDEEALEFVTFHDEARMVDAIAGELEDPTPEEKEVSLGLTFPEDFAGALEAGARPTVTLYVDARVPPQLQRALASETREMAWVMRTGLQGRDPRAEQPVVYEPERMVLGEDRADNPVPLREKVRPMLAVLILMLSAIAIAGLVAVEIEQRTVTALLVTPARIADVLVAKGITGTVLGLSQVLLFLLITWSFGAHPWLVVLLLTLGAAMMAAVGLIAGAAGRDFMTTMFFAIALIIPMTIPTFAVLFPGSTSLWIRVMPSYGFTEALVQLLGYGRSPGELVGYVLLTLAWTAGLFLIALVVLRRRMEAI